jgi:beta-galactosidase
LPSNRGVTVLISRTEREHFSPASRHYVPTTDKSNNNILYTGDSWKSVDLPHDFIIEGIPAEHYNPSLGYLPYDNGWYIKYLEFDEADKGKRISIYFEGVATTATVYLNGCLLKRSFTGYTPFEVDITDIVRFGERNNLAVYVNTQSHEGWWYEGGGIYRNVHIIKTHPLAVDLYGVYAKPIFDDGKWSIDAEVTVRNDHYTNEFGALIGEIIDQSGAIVATAHAKFTAEARSKTAVSFSSELQNAHRWSPEDPYLYTLRVKVIKDGEAVDEYSTRFGCRTFYIDAEKGLFINGKHYKIKGMCGHIDCGLMGKAVPDNIHRYKVELMKEMGCNGYRCSHYPQTEALMDALDEAGFIVMDEVRRFESSEENMANIDTLVKRDRNRPSVFFWSMGNEELYHAEDQGRNIYAAMAARTRALDSTRPIMTAVNIPAVAKVFDQLDIIGLNYNWWHYDSVREKFPNKTIIATECCATGTTRGWYFPDAPEKGYITAYDHTTNPQNHLHYSSREFYWKHITSRDWVLGCYQWDAFEHRGEATWPRLCSQSGAIDLFMQKKDAFYQNKSHFTEEPMVHLLPHWNFRGLEGNEITVFAYTNAEELELFLNEKSLGRRTIEKYGHGEWSVSYQPGKLRVVAYNGGVEVASDERVTSGNAYRLVLRQDNADVRANGEDIAILTCSVLDKDGLEVYDASPTVSFSSGDGCSIYSTGSDISEHDTIFKTVRRMRAGKISVAVKLGTKAEGLKVFATSEGLLSASLNIKTK